MTTAVYATRQDLDDFGGLPDGMLANEGRLVASALASTDTLELAAHGFQTDNTLTVRATEGGTVPAPLVAGTVYYAIRLADDTFKLSATAGGAAINLTTDGVSLEVAKALPIDRMLEAYSRWVDDLLPAHLVPLASPYPILIVKAVAQLAAAELLARAGRDSEIVKTRALEMKAQIDRWVAGRPLRDTKATGPANLAISSPVTVDARGYGSGMLP